MIESILEIWDIYSPLFIEGTLNTILISFYAVILGLIFGSIIALFNLSENAILKFIGGAYIKIVRGTPLLVQLFIIYFGLTSLHLPDFLSGVIAVGFNATAYIAEIVRGGIQSIDNGQMESATALGLSYWQAMKKVIFPQSLRHILPAIGNEFAALIKETSIVSYLGIRDLMFSSDTVRGATYTIFEPLLIVALIYFILTTSVSFLVNKLDKKLKMLY